MVSGARRADRLSMGVDGRLVAFGTNGDGQPWSRQITPWAALNDVLWVARLQDEAEQFRIGMNRRIEEISGGVRHVGSGPEGARYVRRGPTETRQVVDAAVAAAYERHVRANVGSGVVVGTAEGADPASRARGPQVQAWIAYVAALRNIATVHGIAPTAEPGRP
jgi:hypothetical protein